MDFRKLGNSDLTLSSIGLGCMTMSGVYGEGDDKSSIATLHRSIELGINHWDSSDMYGFGHNEELLGKAIKDRRKDVVLTTKFGYVIEDGQMKGIDGSPKFVQAACEASLKRLGVDTIDLYYQHRVDDKVPIEETVGAMGRLVDQGKVRYLGLSEAAPDTIRRAHAERPLSAVQSEFSLLSQDVAESTRPATRELGISFVAYSPLGRGLLTGTIHGAEDLADGDRRHAHPRFQEENLDHNVALAGKIVEIAKEKGVKPPQLVLAWLLAQGDDVVPIPGTKRIPHLEDNAQAVSIKLDASELSRISEAIPSGASAGMRYPEANMGSVQR